MITNLPNLIILDMGDDNSEQMEFLEKKAGDFNSAPIPVIITGPSQEKTYIASLAKYGVIKYFAKPIQFDVFFEAIGKVLKIPLSMDSTPCVLDLHRNGNIIFIELAEGLNRDKLALLQLKLSELIQTEQIESPKVVVMLTNLELSFVDGYNLEFLLDNIIACPRIHKKNIKILSFSPYVKELLAGHDNYSEIEMASNLPKVLNSLVDTTMTSSVSDLITDKILTSTSEDDLDSTKVKTKFSSDAINSDLVSKDDGTVLNIAVIDSNDAELKQTMDIFTSIGANCEGFKGGQEFLTSFKTKNNYDFIILDVFLADQTGLSLLQRLHNQVGTPPVIVYSRPVQKDVAVKILSLGAKTLIFKPQKANILIQKCFNLLKS